MVPNSPAEALGSHASLVREGVVEIVRSRHDHAAEAHQAAGTRYTLVFGAQWRDLLEDAWDWFTRLGYQDRKLPPAGYRIPIVNGCLVYVWRMPDTPEAVRLFASSPTRKNGFASLPADPTLFDPSVMDGSEPGKEVAIEQSFRPALLEAADKMPMVLVTVQSSPRQLQSIHWGVAVLDEATGKVELRGQESIWEPDALVEGNATNMVSFDAGTPVGPAVTLQAHEGTHPDA